MKKLVILIAVLVLLIGGTGFIIYRAVVPGFSSGQSENPMDTPDVNSGILPTLVPSIVVELSKSKTANNTIDLQVKNLKNSMVSIGYEISYESQGLVKGVNSGSKPIDVTQKDSFSREVYLGTCSRNVCKPDTGVNSVSVVLEFTDTVGKKSQFSKEFEL